MRACSSWRGLGRTELVSVGSTGVILPSDMKCGLSARYERFSRRHLDEMDRTRVRSFGRHSWPCQSPDMRRNSTKDGSLESTGTEPPSPVAGGVSLLYILGRKSRYQIPSTTGEAPRPSGPLPFSNIINATVSVSCGETWPAVGVAGGAFQCSGANDHVVPLAARRSNGCMAAWACREAQHQATLGRAAACLSIGRWGGCQL